MARLSLIPCLLLALMASSASAARVAERVAPDSVKIDWSGCAESTPVSIYVADEPDAPVRERRLLRRS